MLGRAEKVTAGAVVVEVLVTSGTVGPRCRVATGAVEAAEVAGARDCGAVGATKVARLAEAGCRAAGATEVARSAEAGCCAAGATELARLAEAGYCTAGPTKVARLAEADCCAAGSTEVARLVEAGGCWAAGTGGGCRECAHSTDMYEAWLRSTTAMAAAIERFWASREARRASCSLRARVVSSIPARVVMEVWSRAAIFVHIGRSSRSCSAAAMSSAC